MCKDLLTNASNVYRITDGPPERLESAILKYEFYTDYSVRDMVGWFVLLISAANREAKSANDDMSRSKYLNRLQELFRHNSFRDCLTKARDADGVEDDGAEAVIDGLA
jgi:hypothetical protein